MFEEGVSSPTASHAAWSAAASSLQMRHALPEVAVSLSRDTTALLNGCLRLSLS